MAGSSSDAAPRDPRETILLYTDGACSGNPGPGGWAAILVHPATGKRREISGAERQTTNNRMELTAVIEGLKLLAKPARVEVHSDSIYVVKGMTEWIHDWIRRGWKTAAKKPVLNEDLWRELYNLARAQKEVTFHWVAGHAGHPENERCDQLAVAACRELMKG
ncbi:MAG: ribonuclease HI [Candidatus Eisenbacteria bacterium]|nr:ribonuclease HI [Candidatus Eisenbacteria bacterium]